jgi:uncharacterized membrane protein
MRTVNIAVGFLMVGIIFIMSGINTVSFYIGISVTVISVGLIIWGAFGYKCRTRNGDKMGGK